MQDDIFAGSMYDLCAQRCQGCVSYDTLSSSYAFNVYSGPLYFSKLCLSFRSELDVYVGGFYQFGTLTDQSLFLQTVQCMLHEYNLNEHDFTLMQLSLSVILYFVQPNQRIENVFHTVYKDANYNILYNPVRALQTTVLGGFYGDTKDRNAGLRRISAYGTIPWPITNLNYESAFANRCRQTGYVITLKDLIGKRLYLKMYGTTRLNWTPATLYFLREILHLEYFPLWFCAKRVNGLTQKIIEMPTLQQQCMQVIQKHGLSPVILPWNLQRDYQTFLRGLA